MQVPPGWICAFLFICIPFCVRYQLVALFFILTDFSIRHVHLLLVVNPYRKYIDFPTCKVLALVGITYCAIWHLKGRSKKPQVSANWHIKIQKYINYFLPLNAFGKCSLRNLSISVSG